MTILLTGATGFIGSEVVRHLAAAGQPTQVMIPRPSRAPLPDALDVEPLYGDLSLWSELDLVPRYRGVLEGTPACLDGFVAFRWRRVHVDAVRKIGGRWAVTWPATRWGRTTMR